MGKLREQVSLKPQIQIYLLKKRFLENKELTNSDVNLIAQIKNLCLTNTLTNGLIHYHPPPFKTQWFMSSLAS